MQNGSVATEHEYPAGQIRRAIILVIIVSKNEMF